MVSYKIQNNTPAESTSQIKVIENHIYFYADVETDSCLELINKIRETHNYLKSKKELLGLKENTPIWLHIQSYGGGVFEAFGVCDFIRSINSPVYAIVEGVAASAGTLIAISCNKVYITKDSFFMIHQLSTFFWGKYEELYDEKKLVDKMMDKIVKMYSKKTGIKKKKIRKMLKRDCWLDADEAEDLGFVDKILN